MSDLHWLALLAIMSGAFGRMVKIYPKIPKGLLPWLVLLAGYLLSFGMGLYNGSTFWQAATYAWTGVVGGLVAIGGHRSLKPLMVWLFGEKNATAVLGRLRAKGEM